MKRIFINTDFERLRANIIGRKDSYIGINNLSDENKVLYYNLQTGLFVCNLIETNIILIKDEIPNFDFTDFKITDKDYILHHSKPLEIGENIFNSRRKEGQHIPNNLVYTPVFNIIFNDKIKPKDKAQHIIDFLFPVNLEIALDFLHDCLNEITPDLPEELAKNEGIKTTYNDWKATPNNEKLKPLRDNVLEWAEAD